MAEAQHRLNEPTQAELAAALPEIAVLLRTIYDAERSVLALSGRPPLESASEIIELFSHVSDADTGVRRAILRARQVAA